MPIEDVIGPMEMRKPVTSDAEPSGKPVTTDSIVKGVPVLSDKMGPHSTWKPVTSDDGKTSLQREAEIRQEMRSFANNLTSIVQRSMQEIQAENTATRDALVNTIAKVSAEKTDTIERLKDAQYPQTPAMCIRYRNKNDGSANDHRLEYIFHATATDPETGIAWPDDAWTAIEGADAVEVTL